MDDRNAPARRSHAGGDDTDNADEHRLKYRTAAPERRLFCYKGNQSVSPLAGAKNESKKSSDEIRLKN